MSAASWTERDHWAVVLWDAGERMSVLHFETKQEAQTVAARKRRTHKGPMRSVSVEPVGKSR